MWGLASSDSPELPAHFEIPITSLTTPCLLRKVWLAGFGWPATHIAQRNAHELTARRKQPSSGPPRIHFPEDEGAHPNALIEWWYLNTALTGSDGGEYGAMVAYFSPGLKIIAISDIDGRTLHHEVAGSTPRFAEGALDLVWGGRDRWRRAGSETPLYRLEAKGKGIGLDLSMESQKPPMLAGGDGLVQWSGGTSYYYSLTRLEVGGWIQIGGRQIDVEGAGWMDHQWMANLGRRGWDWFSVQLDNDTELLVWQIVNPDDSIESRDLMIMFPDCSMYHTHDVAMQSVESWVSPATGREYGIVWQVKERTQGVDLEIRARYPEQEIRMFELMPEVAYQFWEGNTVVAGWLGGNEVGGNGHAEIVRSISPLDRVP